MAPCEARRARAVRGEARRRYEVEAVHHHEPARVREVERDEPVRGLTRAVRVLLLHREQEAPVRRACEVGVARVRERRRHGLAAEPLDAGPREVGIDERVAERAELAAAVFVHPRAHVGAGRRELARRAVPEAHQRDAAALLRPALEPARSAAPEARRGDAPRACRDASRAQGRRPRTVGSRASHRRW
jgi:hypothetical protein